jgi:hypothetical protein
MRTFGWELIVDADKCDLEKIQSLDNIQAFIDELLLVTKMQKMGELHSHYLEDTPEHREKGIIGWSVCQLIVTSSLVIHFCENPDRNYGTMYLNFFSCKEYERKDVVEMVKKYFGGRIRNNNYIRRDATSNDFIVS